MSSLHALKTAVATQPMQCKLRELSQGVKRLSSWKFIRPVEPTRKRKRSPADHSETDQPRRGTDILAIEFWFENALNSLEHIVQTQAESTAQSCVVQVRMMLAHFKKAPGPNSRLQYLQEFAVKAAQSVGGPFRSGSPVFKPLLRRLFDSDPASQISADDKHCRLLIGALLLCREIKTNGALEYACRSWIHAWQTLVDFCLFPRPVGLHGRRPMLATAPTTSADDRTRMLRTLLVMMGACTRCLKIPPDATTPRPFAAIDACTCEHIDSSSSV